jgi:hypothetical protein
MELLKPSRCFTFFLDHKPTMFFCGSIIVFFAALANKAVTESVRPKASEAWKRQV